MKNKVLLVLVMMLILPGCAQKAVEPIAVHIPSHPVNYLPAGAEYPPLPEKYTTLTDYLQAFRAVSKPGTAFFKTVQDFNANMVYIRIRKNNGEAAVVSMIINRWHDNVDFLFKEKATLHPEKDHADFIPGFHGSYPNYFIDVAQDDLPDFFNLLANLDQMPEEAARQRFHKYGINQANENFWEYYDWFQDRFNKDEPVQSGLFDLNRYYHQTSHSVSH